MEGYILDINKKLLTRVRDGADRPSPQHPACGFTWGVSLKSSGRNRISKLFPFCYCRKSSVTYHPHFCAFVGGLQSNSFIYTPQLAADTLCRRGPGRRSSKSGDPLVKCRVNTLYAKCEEGESEATCRPSLLNALFSISHLRWPIPMNIFVGTHCLGNVITHNHSATRFYFSPVLCREAPSWRFLQQCDRCETPSGPDDLLCYCR
jgi:hypothetical protein